MCFVLLSLGGFYGTFASNFVFSYWGINIEKFGGVAWPHIKVTSPGIPGSVKLSQ